MQHLVQVQYLVQLQHLIKVQVKVHFLDSTWDFNHIVQHLVQVQHLIQVQHLVQLQHLVKLQVQVNQLDPTYLLDIFQMILILISSTGTEGSMSFV